MPDIAAIPPGPTSTSLRLWFTASTLNMSEILHNSVEIHSTPLDTFAYANKLSKTTHIGTAM